jgi:NADH:ubiquinone oxidoreductase subunit 3 (subunit A)
VILLMFVIFDLEIVLLLGCLLATNGITFFMIMIIVIGRVYLEAYLGKLKWMV